MTNFSNIAAQPAHTRRNDISYNQNIKKIQAYLNNEVTEETITFWLNSISEVSRRIIECKFGLIGDTEPCKTFKQLNECLGINNSKEALEAALKELKEVKYLIILADAEKLDRQIAIGVGRFAYAIEIAEKNGDLLGKEILNELDKEPFESSAAIYYRFGICEDGVVHTQADTAKHFGNKSPEAFRRLEFNIGRYFRHPDVRRKVSVYYGNCYKEKLERERLEQKDRKDHPERYIPAHHLKEQNNFCHTILRALEGFSYIYQVAIANPEDIAIKFHMNLDDAEKLSMAARNFDYGRFIKLSMLYKKDLNEFGFSKKAKDLFRKLGIRNTKGFLEVTPSQLRTYPYTQTAAVEEILK